jgi:hypothetical protein
MSAPPSEQKVQRRVKPVGPRTFLAQKIERDKPVIYIPEGSVVRGGPERMMVMDLSPDLDGATELDWGIGDVVIVWLNALTDLGGGVWLGSADHVLAYEIDP